MRRAVVISLVLHLLVLAALFDRSLFLPGLPATAGKVLRANLRVQPIAASSLAVPVGPSSPKQADDGGRRVVQDISDRPTMVVKPPNPREKFRPVVASIPHLLEPLREPHGEGDLALPADVEREFRLLLARQLRQSGGLPPSGGTGTARLSITHQGLAGSSDVTLTHSSGNAEFDAYALASLKAALGHASLPQAAQGRRFRMPFVLEYRAVE